jgi:hypothetical protein
MYFWFTDVNKTQNILTLNRTRTSVNVVVNMHIYNIAFVNPER